MARPKKAKSAPATDEQEDRFRALVGAIPEDAFVQLVSKCLPAAEARELCELFREMKG